jgi:hypothetical protein
MNRQEHTRLTQSLKRKYESARYSLLLVLILTALNCALLFFGQTTYFLFSAQFLYYLLFFAKFFTGKMDPTIYGEDWDIGFLPQGVYIAAIVFIAIALSLYFLCWFKSKNLHKNWLIAAFLMFVADAVLSVVIFGYLMANFVTFNILDYIVIAYVLYSFISGIVAYFKLAKLPQPIEEPETLPADDFGFATEDFATENATEDTNEKTEE